MKKIKATAFALFVTVCLSAFVPALAWAKGLSDKYNLTISGEYIFGIPAGVSAEDFVSTMKESTTVTMTANAKSFIGTGCIINIADKGSYKAVILGDVDGSGVVDTTDYLRIKQYYLHTLTLEGEFYKASDVDGSAVIDTTDYLRVKGHFLGVYDLFADSYLPEIPTEDESSETQFEDMSEIVKSGNFVDPLEVGYDKISNPVVELSDPYVTYHDGKYYYSFLFWGGIFIKSFDKLDELSIENAVYITPENLPENAKNNIWSPKLQFIDGFWYVYYSATDGVDENRRMYALKSKTENPLGEYEFAGQISPSTDRWASNGSAFEYKDELYFMWSGWEGNENVAQNIYIAKMSSPTSISGDRVCISIPEKDWEKNGGSPLINDAPFAISSNDYLSILYSASGSWCDDYCVGQLIFKGGDVLNPENWEKQSDPILEKNPNRFYAPGNCCITTDSKGVMWIVFHANKEAGKGWDGRSTWMYPVRINEKGVVEVIFGDVVEAVENAGFVDPLEVGFTKVNNPIHGGADPSIVYYNGKYYNSGGFLGTIFITIFDSLDTMGNASYYAIDYTILPVNDDIWAPDIHFIDGRWYIYYTAGKDEAHRMYVIRSKTDDILGEYEYLGQVTDSTDKWAIDGTVFEYKDEMYFLWSGWEGDTNIAQNLYIAKMSSPTTISSERICISRPELEWEIKGGSPLINEGPCVISQGDYLSILYSASGSWCDDYCIGQLIFTGGDVLDPDNWEKQSEPILQKDPEWFYGPGHCCIIKDENDVMWIVFHANTESGTGWDGRSIRTYPIRINEKGVVEVILYK